MRIIRGKDLGEDFFAYQHAEELSSVEKIIEDVRRHGDAAVLEYTRKFDGVQIESIPLEAKTVTAAYSHVEAGTFQALKTAAENIAKFSEIQKKQFQDFEVELLPGVITGQKVIPIGRVGVYVPGGSFPLLSTLLMGAIPAKVAGVEVLTVCSPPTNQGCIHPAILVAADIAGVDEIYQIGGVQAIAAMAYGTESVKKVDKIIGPGNKYVAQAKREVFGVVGIDFIAGPTEILIIADDHANAALLAADLLAQAEHDEDAIPILVTTSENLAHEVVRNIQQQLQSLKTRGIAQISIENNGYIILVENIAEAITIANRKAPEHLELQINDPSQVISELKNYGSLFIGELAAEALGDYSSGINHILPTNTTARYTSGLSVRDFLKFPTSLQVSARGLAAIGPMAEALAEAEGLHGHGESIKIRMSKVKADGPVSS